MEHKRSGSSVCLSASNMPAEDPVSGTRVVRRSVSWVIIYLVRYTLGDADNLLIPLA
jgi:hypothetical protein